MSQMSSILPRNMTANPGYILSYLSFTRASVSVSQSKKAICMFLIFNLAEKPRQ